MGEEVKWLFKEGGGLIFEGGLIFGRLGYSTFQPMPKLLETEIVSFQDTVCFYNHRLFVY